MNNRHLALSSAVVLLIAFALALPSLANANPGVSIEISPPMVGGSGSAQVNATIDNTSGEFALIGMSAKLELPPDTSITGGDDNPFFEASLGIGDSATPTWLVQNSGADDKTFSVTISGTIDDQPFTETAFAALEVDAAPPVVTVNLPSMYSTTPSPTFNWTATDSQSPLAGYDVDAAIDAGGWVPQLVNSPRTSLALTAGEGQLVRVRVRATDSLGNTSAWTEVSTTIDAVPPVVAFGTPDTSVRGTIRVPVFLVNAGSPVTGRYTFADTAGGRTGVVASGQYVSYKNITRKQVIASLRATATDALGRSATFSQDFPVQTRLAPSGMRVLKLSRVGRYVKISGKTQKKYNGKVTFSAKRIGKKGTRKASKRVKVRKGRFTIKIRVAKGRYKFVVTAGSTSKYAETSISKKLTVR